jgi:hypothetical protein
LYIGKINYKLCPSKIKIDNFDSILKTENFSSTAPTLIKCALVYKNNTKNFKKLK